MNFIKIVFTICIAALAGCASPPAEAPTKLVVKKIAILPVQELATASLENRNSVVYAVPIASVGFHLDSKAKQQMFSEKLLAQKLTLGSDLTSYLAQTLAKDGFEVTILSEVPRPVDDPEDVDYETIKTDADAILHVYFDDVGLFSGMTSSDYLPRVNVEVRLHSTKRNEDLYDETLCYGVDARHGEKWAIADPKFAYPTFDTVMTKIPEIAAAFSAGAQAVGERAAGEIQSAVK